MKKEGQGKHWREDNGLGRGGDQGRIKGGVFGSPGYCVCTICDQKVPNQQGLQCTTIKCPTCGYTIVREELLNQKR